MATTVQEKLRLRKYEPSDLDKVERLFRTHYDAGLIEKRRAVFDWIARYNPASDIDTNYLVVEAEGKIVAYMGRMPVDMIIAGRKQRGYFIHDLLVDPEYREKGLGLYLDSSLQSTWEEATGTFMMGMWMNQFSLKAWKRKGNYHLDAPCFLKPINFGAGLARFIGNRSLARLLASPVQGLSGAYDFFLSGRRHPEISISQVTRFDRRFDDLAQRLSGEFTLIVLRSSAYLNWKYVDKPFSGYTIFAAERNNVLAGFIVLLPKIIGGAKMGVIVDILADPGDSRTIASLCRQAIRFFKREKVDFSLGLLTDDRFSKVFRRHLFFKRRQTAPVMLANLHKYGAREQLKDVHNWFLTYGDSDGFVWQ